MTSPVSTPGATRVVAVFALAALLAGCASASSPSSSPRQTEANNPAPSTSVPTVAPVAVTLQPTTQPDRNPSAFVENAPYSVAIDPAAFSSTITNPFFPLEPGTTSTYDGGGEHIVVTVTGQTRVIAGVATLVVHDQAFEGDALVEDTEDYYAQDPAGNVWYFGEVTGECDGQTVTSRHGSWEAHLDGAEPGVVMLAQPQVGDVYRQEYLAGEAEDQATVLKLDGIVSGPTGDYVDVLVTEDVTPLEPDLLEHKSYARGVGVVLEETLSGDGGVLKLTDITIGNAPLPSTSPFSPCQG
jgi:hypothetical protein